MSPVLAELRSPATLPARGQTAEAGYGRGALLTRGSINIYALKYENGVI